MELFSPKIIELSSPNIKKLLIFQEGTCKAWKQKISYTFLCK